MTAVGSSDQSAPWSQIMNLHIEFSRCSLDWTTATDSRIQCGSVSSTGKRSVKLAEGPGCHPASYPKGTGYRAFFQRVKWPEHEADHSPPYSAAVQAVWSVTSTTAMWCLSTGTTFTTNLSGHLFTSLMLLPWKYVNCYCPRILTFHFV
jgi:hypothetical protein